MNWDDISTSSSFERSDPSCKKPDQTTNKPEPVLCRSGSLFLHRVSACDGDGDCVEGRHGCKGTMVDDDGENGTSRKEKVPLGLLKQTNGGDTGETHVYFVAYRFRGDVRCEGLFFLWYNTYNSSPLLSKLGYRHGPLTHSKTAFPSDTAGTLPLQHLCATCHTPATLAVFCVRCDEQREP